MIFRMGLRFESAAVNSLVADVDDLLRVGTPRRQIEARLREIAASGGERGKTAARALAVLEGRGENSADNILAKFHGWRCPACGGKAASLGTRTGVFKCERGHRRMSNGGHLPFALMLRPF